ncbi:HAMP domain-containing sensor histidine kinase [Hyphomicrobium sp.]|uniref:sensor histidine kinase n=1 Tax=Hyphomicrobium sp. TaxID=82 RepID=UPI002E33D790|nr:HAMP domain-containing sensor histidine kinase [Hyphomicrobium sp.]HEX2839661.1 HAMP domain-containing sensor histidine kinase [Hyphomicrobium sp.]
MRSWTIKKRLVTSLIALIGAFWIVGVVGAALVVRHELNELFDSALRETTGQIIPIALREYELKKSGKTEDIDPILNTRRGHVHFLLRAKDGTVLIKSYGTPETALLVGLKNGFTNQSGFRYYSRFLKNKQIWVQVAQVLEERHEATVGLWLALASPLLALLPIAALAVWWTVTRATEPISHISRELEARGGDYLEPVETAGLPDELRPMTDAINTLMSRLKAALEQERAFAANAAHELRNPIASARAQVQVLADKLSGTFEQARAENIASSLGQLGRRIEKLLQMSRADAGLGHSRERTDLNLITDLLVDEFKRRPDVGPRLKLEMASRKPSWVAMDQDALAIVLRNALENAVIHGSRTGPIEIRVGSDQSVRVINDCVPIAPENLAELKNRFRRGGQRSASGGTGLGLAIVDTIVHQAGGTVDLLSPATEKSDGFEIVLRFPRTA